MKKNAIILFFLFLSSQFSNGSSNNNRCYLLSGYIYDIIYPDTYLLKNERIIINGDTIYSDNHGHFEYVVFYSYPRDLNIFDRNNFRSNLNSLEIIVRNKKIILMNNLRKFNRLVRKEKIPILNLSIRLEKSDSNYLLISEIQ